MASASCPRSSTAKTKQKKVISKVRKMTTKTYGRGLPPYFMYSSFVLYVRSLILLCELCHYMRWIVILSLCIYNGIFTIIQLCMFNAMLGIVNMAISYFV